MLEVPDLCNLNPCPGDWKRRIPGQPAPTMLVVTMSSAQWLWVLPGDMISRGAEPRPSALAAVVALVESALEGLAEAEEDAEIALEELAEAELAVEIALEELAEAQLADEVVEDVISALRSPKS